MKITLLFAVLSLAACGKAGAPEAIPGGYDASRDAAADIKNAVTAAKSAHKRVLIEAGGNGCSWCTIMHRFYDANPSLAAARDKNYITVKVNVESGGPVPAALKSYPAPDRYPHLYVLDENGSLIQSQNMSDFEKGKDYDLGKFSYFINEFGPPKH